MDILIVDDDPLQRRLMSASLSNAGYRLHEAADGIEALNMLAKSHIRLLLTDWMMPGMDGVELVQQIRAANLPHYVYIMLLTARDRKHDIISGLEAGVDDYVTKPFDPQELRARVAIGARIVQLETQLRETLDQLQTAATHDYLTGLLNRAALTEHIQAEIAHAVRIGGLVSLIMLDIDNFKQLNDQYGHLIGDQALRYVADILRASLRPYDRVGRWGGEEFLIAVASSSLAETQQIAERIRESIARSPLLADTGIAIRITTSIGITTESITQHTTLDTLIQHADIALYRAKHLGRNRVESFRMTMLEFGAAQ